MVRRVYGNTPTSLRRPDGRRCAVQAADLVESDPATDSTWLEIGPFVPDRPDGRGHAADRPTESMHLGGLTVGGVAHHGTCVFRIHSSVSPPAARPLHSSEIHLIDAILRSKLDNRSSLIPGHLAFRVATKTGTAGASTLKPLAMLAGLTHPLAHISFGKTHRHMELLDK